MKRFYLYILVCVFVGYSCDDMNDFEQGTLKGYVLDAVTGEGLADVDVVLEPVVAANGSVTSKSDGHFNLSRLVTGTYSVNVRKSGASIIAVSYTHLDVYKRQLPTNHRSKYWELILM